MPLQQRRMFTVATRNNSPYPAIISLTLCQAWPLGREQEEHIQHCAITAITSLRSDMHWERGRGVAYLRQIILSQLYLEARMRRLGSIMPPRRRSTRWRVDSATQSHIMQGSDSGTHTHTHTLCTTARDKGVEEENAVATTWTETSWLRVFCCTETQSLDQSLTCCTETIWP